VERGREGGRDSKRWFISVIVVGRRRERKARGGRIGGREEGKFSERCVSAVARSVIDHLCVSVVSRRRRIFERGGGKRREGRSGFLSSFLGQGGREGRRALASFLIVFEPCHV